MSHCDKYLNFSTIFFFLITEFSLDEGVLLYIIYRIACVAPCTHTHKELPLIKRTLTHTDTHTVGNACERVRVDDEVQSFEND